MLKINQYQTRSGLTLENAILKITQLTKDCRKSDMWENQQDNQITKSVHDLNAYMTFRVGVFADKEKHDQGFSPVEYLEFPSNYSQTKQDHAYLRLDSEDVDAFELAYAHLQTMEDFQAAISLI